MSGLRLPVMPPVEPMLAKSVPLIPDGALSFEPKWDGFRSIIFRDGEEVEIGSRNGKPMTRYFPEIVEAVIANFPERCVIDGEIVVVVGERLEFEVLQQRIHPANSRVTRLSKETPATFIAFDQTIAASPGEMGVQQAPNKCTSGKSTTNKLRDMFRREIGSGGAPGAKAE